MMESRVAAKLTRRVRRQINRDRARSSGHDAQGSAVRAPGTRATLHLPAHNSKDSHTCDLGGKQRTYILRAGYCRGFVGGFAPYEVHREPARRMVADGTSCFCSFVDVFGIAPDPVSGQAAETQRTDAGAQPSDLKLLTPPSATLGTQHCSCVGAVRQDTYVTTAHDWSQKTASRLTGGTQARSR